MGNRGKAEPTVDPQKKKGWNRGCWGQGDQQAQQGHPRPQMGIYSWGSGGPGLGCVSSRLP